MQEEKPKSIIVLKLLTPEPVEYEYCAECNKEINPTKDTYAQILFNQDDYTKVAKFMCDGCTVYIGRSQKHTVYIAAI